MKKRIAILVSLLAAPLFGQTPAPPDDQKPLAEVIAQVTSALQDYQNNLGNGGADVLPPLKTADFDFKTTTAKVDGITVDLFIFKFGSSHEKDTVNDVTYEYSVPKPEKASMFRFHLLGTPLSLHDELIQTIQSAAKAVKDSATAAGLPFNNLTVNVQYGVKWDVNASGQIQYSFVTVGLSGDRSKNTIQSVKLVFGK